MITPVEYLNSKIDECLDLFNDLIDNNLVTFEGEKLIDEFLLKLKSDARYYVLKSEDSGDE